MQKIKIGLSLISDIKEFISIVSGIDCDIDLVRDKYVIDAKSAMGLFTIDLSKPIDLVIYSDDETIVEKFSKWMV